MYIPHVATEVLYDEVGHLASVLLQINQIKSQILTQLLFKLLNILETVIALMLENCKFRDFSM